MRWWLEKCEKFEHFRYGEIASPALAMLAENGETKKLEIDMKSSSQNIRSVIKARFLIVFFLQPCIADLDVFRMAMVHGFPFFDSISMSLPRTLRLMTMYIVHIVHNVHFLINKKYHKGFLFSSKRTHFVIEILSPSKMSDPYFTRRSDQTFIHRSL